MKIIPAKWIDEVLDVALERGVTPTPAIPSGELPVPRWCAVGNAGGPSARRSCAWSRVCRNRRCPESRAIAGFPGLRLIDKGAGITLPAALLLHWRNHACPLDRAVLLQVRGACPVIKYTMIDLARHGVQTNEQGRIYC